MTDYARSLIEDWIPLQSLLVTDFCLRVLFEDLERNVSSIIIDEKREIFKKRPTVLQAYIRGYVKLRYHICMQLGWGYGRRPLYAGLYTAPRSSPHVGGRNVRSRGVREAILLSGFQFRVQSEEV